MCKYDELMKKHDFLRAEAEKELDKIEMYFDFLDHYPEHDPADEIIDAISDAGFIKARNYKAKARRAKEEAFHYVIIR